MTHNLGLCPCDGFLNFASIQEL